ncbi:MAG: transposase [Candidatus Omnitrophica bacterium]|nr:transposase [Candidatus Omnitrophota bacterium]
MEERLFFSYRNKIISAGEIYHVTQRAPGNEMIFVEEEDYLNILSLLKEWVKEFNLELFSFCLMPNHYHLLFKINEPNLSKAMHSLNTTYALKFNSKYQRKGHVFCGVYRASICLDDTHLIGSSLYIHLNPQKAGLVKKAKDYRWSSVGVYINPEKKSFVKSSYILKIVDDDLQKAADIYESMLSDYLGLEYKEISENPRAVIDFCKGIFQRLPPVLLKRQIKKDFILQELTIDRMIDEVRKKKRRATPRDKEGMVYLMKQLQERGYNVSEIAKILGVTRQTLYNLTNKVQLKV